MANWPKILGMHMNLKSKLVYDISNYMTMRHELRYCYSNSRQMKEPDSFFYEDLRVAESIVTKLSNVVDESYE